MLPSCFFHVENVFQISDFLSNTPLVLFVAVILING